MSTIVFALKQPIFKPFWDMLKMGLINLFGGPKGSKICFGKMSVLPLLDFVLVVNWPIFILFLELLGGQNRSPCAQTGVLHLFWHPKGVWISFFFFFLKKASLTLLWS